MIFFVIYLSVLNKLIINKWNSSKSVWSVPYLACLHSVYLLYYEFVNHHWNAPDKTGPLLNFVNLKTQKEKWMFSECVSSNLQIRYVLCSSSTENLIWLYILTSENSDLCSLSCCGGSSSSFFGGSSSFSLGFLHCWWSIKMLQGIKEFTLCHSPVPLDLNFLLGQWSKQHWDCYGVKDCPVFQGWCNSCSANLGLIIFLNVKEVAHSEWSCGHSAIDRNLLYIVHSLCNSVVLLPLVIIHIFYFIFNLLTKLTLFNMCLFPKINQN